MDMVEKRPKVVFAGDKTSDDLKRCQCEQRVES